MEIISLVGAVVALVLGLLAFRQARAIAAELQQVRGQQYERYYQLLDKSETLEKEVRRLRQQVRPAGGPSAFTPDMTFAEAMELHPEVATVLASYHIGGCSSCAVDPDATLAEGAEQAHVPIAELLRVLNGLLNGERPVARPRGQSGLLQIELEMPAPRS